MSVGNIVRITGLKVPQMRHLNENFGKITGEKINRRFTVVPFTKLAPGGTRVLREQYRSVYINGNNLKVLSKNDKTSEHMRLYIEYLTSKLSINIGDLNYEEQYSHERRSELEELHGLTGSYMKPALILDLAFLVRTDRDFERSCMLFRKVYYSPFYDDDPDLNEETKCSIVLIVMETLIIIQRYHAALDMLEFVPVTNSKTRAQEENFFRYLVSIADKLKLDICTEIALKKILELDPTNETARFKLAGYYHAMGRLQDAIDLFPQSGEDSAYVSNLKKIKKRGKYTILPETCSRSNEVDFPWKRKN